MSPAATAPSRPAGHARRRGRPAAGGQRGSVSLEVLGFTPLVLLVVLAAWQMQTITVAATAAEQAARVGSRVESRGGDGAAAALDALGAELRRHADAAVTRDDDCDGGGSIGTRVVVCVRVPAVIPFVDLEVFEVRRDAELPPHLGRGR